MERPSHADYRRAVELVAELYAAADADACRLRFVTGIATLVGCAERERLLFDLVVPHFRRALRRAGQHAAGAYAPTASVPLTARETEILEHVATGATNDAIGQLLGISPRTVQAHLSNAFEKLGTRSRAGAAAWLLRARATSSASVSG